MGRRIVKRKAVVARIARARPERVTKPAAIQHSRTVDPLINTTTVGKMQLSLHPGAGRQVNFGDIGGHVVIRVSTSDQRKSSLKDQGVYIMIQVRELRVVGDGPH